jgi:hypothetical protein
MPAAPRTERGLVRHTTYIYTPKERPMHATIHEHRQQPSQDPSVTTEVSAVVGLASEPTPDLDMVCGRIGVAAVRRARVLASGRLHPDDEASLRRALEGFAASSGETNEDVEQALRSLSADLVAYASPEAN